MIHGKNLVQMIIDTNDNITPEAKKAAVDYLAALREAGKKMAEILNKDLAQNGASSEIFYAIQAWEAANK